MKAGATQNHHVKDMQTSIADGHSPVSGRASEDSNQLNATPTGPIASAAESDRIHAMDRLRACAMFLGIVTHGGIAYTTVDHFWGVWDDHRHRVFNGLVVMLHGFRMPLFFFIAGFFARMLHLRLGSRQFAVHRLNRILVPLIAGLVVIVPVSDACWKIGREGFGWHVAEYFTSGSFFENINLWHLWFLYYLLLLYLIAVPASIGLKRWIPATRAARFDAYFKAAIRSFWAPVWLGLITLTLASFDYEWGHVNTGNFVPNGIGVAYYLLFFSFGWLLHRQHDLLPTFKTHAPTHLVCSVVLLAPILYLIRFEDNFHSVRFLSHYVICKTAWCLYTWFMIFGITGCALKWFNRPNHVFRYLADASYWCYLAHIPILILAQRALLRFDLSPFVKFSAAVTVTFLVLLVSYEYLVRYRVVGVYLHGHRKRT